ncbi:MAG: uroporphyrinogen decarboxylase [Gammaproteobacteria bacterium]|nr:uroporphyrinogen decarboxylase [Gammaproteobacteria bacterium]
MKAIQNDRFLKALRREPVDHTPIWIMRQAGRYLPEYRELRKKAGDFLSLCKNPELACEATMQPIRRFDLDAAILFSDILTIPDAMGLGLSFLEGEGPHFAKTIRSMADVKALPILDPNRDLGYVMQAVKTIKRELHNKVPLIGFSGSPWTLATYMIEGGSSKDFNQAKAMLYKAPEIMKALLTSLSQAVTDYLAAQIDAGVDVVMIFDTWGGLLTPECYREFSLHYMQQVVSTLKSRYPAIPIILFSKGCAHSLTEMADTGASALGIDWTTSIGKARKLVGNKVALQGNLDPSVLYAEPTKIRSEAARIIHEFGRHPGHIFNLGHGIHPGINPDHVATLIDEVHSVSSNESSST